MSSRQDALRRLSNKLNWSERRSNLTSKRVYGVVALVGAALLGWPAVAAEAQDRAQIKSSCGNTFEPDNQAKTGEKGPAMYHVITNSYLEFVDKDHARPADAAPWSTATRRN
jgi:hypothetical protein